MSKPQRSRVAIVGCALALGLIGAIVAQAKIGSGPVDQVTVPPLGVARDGSSVGIDPTGAIKLPTISEATRPVVTGREVGLSTTMAARVESSDEAVVTCMAAQGARKINVNPGRTPVWGFDDPDLSAQEACAPVMQAADALSMDPEFRVAALAAEALRREIKNCIGERGYSTADTAPDKVFGECLSIARTAVEG